MKKILIACFALASISAFASSKNCSVHINFKGNDREIQVLEKALLKNKFTISETVSEADYTLDGYSMCYPGKVRCEAVITLDFKDRRGGYRMAAHEDQNGFNEISSELALKSAAKKMLKCKKLKNLHDNYGNVMSTQPKFPYN